MTGADGAGLARSAGLSGMATLASRVLGLIRDLVLATLFGAGHEMDAFVVAFRVPNLVRDLFAEGALSAAFVPTFTRRLACAGKTEAWRLGNNLLNALVVVTLTVVAAGFLFAKPLVTLYAGQFQDVPGKIELTIDLARVMLPFLTLAAVAAALMGMLNSLHHYFVPALAPSMFNVATIACAIGLVPVMPALGLPPILAVAIGALVGGVGQIAVQWPSLRREGFRYRATLDFRDRSLLPVLLLMGPGTLGLAATQLNLFVTTFLATGQGEGAVSWLQYAFRLMYLPLGLFGVSIATALLPAAARHAAANSDRDVRSTVADGLSLMLAVNVPATFGLLVLAPDIVGLLFEHGRFLPGDTLATAAAVRCYAVGLIGYSATRIASPVFYALGSSRTPALVSMTAVVINIAASLVLIGWLAFLGLALATSMAAIAGGALSVALLGRRLGGLDVRALVLFGLKVTAATAIMAGVVAGAAAAIRVPQGVALEALRLLAVIGIGLFTLSVVSRRLRIAQYSESPDRAPRARIWCPTPLIGGGCCRSSGQTGQSQRDTIGSRIMRRPSSSYGAQFAFGPGPLSPAIKALIVVNVLMFLAQRLVPGNCPPYGCITSLLGLMPAEVIWQLRIWQLGTYMFLHGGTFHILFNMLALWMFGTELERMWGTRQFLKFYFVTGVGAALLTVAFSLLPAGFARGLHYSIVVGASGAIYGLLLAWALYFPDRPIYMYFVFPVRARTFVLIMGALAFYSSVAERAGVANATHLGGLLVAYLFLNGFRARPLAELKYRYLKWRMGRVRKRFDVYTGGRGKQWDRHVH